MPLMQDIPPVAEQVQPPSPETLYQQGVAARRAGRAAEAAALLAAVVQARPEDVDARLNLGLALFALDRLDEAEREFARVVADSPTYLEAHVARARTASRRGDTAAALLHLSQAEALGPGNPDIAEARRSVMASEAPGWQIDATVARSDLGADLASWEEVSLGLLRQINPRTSIGASVASTERFGLRDVYIEASINRRFSWGGGYLALGGTPDADYRPEAALRAGVEVPVGRGVATTLDTSAARFPVGTISSVQPGIQWSGASGRLTVGARWINTWDENGDRQDGFALRSTVAVHERLTLRIGFADAPETSEGVTTPVVSHSLGVEFAVTDRIDIRLTGVDEDRGAYDRREVSVGLGLRF